jgi:hypothetical protein
MKKTRNGIERCQVKCDAGRSKPHLCKCIDIWNWKKDRTKRNIIVSIS